MENEKHIIYPDKIMDNARPISKHVSPEDVMTFIRECENMDIIPAIGVKTFNELCEEELSNTDSILLSGGEWTDSEGILRKCYGLQMSLSYFVYAKMSMSDGGILTRSGVMQHNDDYAARSDDKNRVKRYNDLMDIAEEYLESSLQYMKSLDKTVKPARGTRMHIHAIGD